MNTTRKVDFIGIGAAKSGTTWLADNLRKHPQIYIPELKELTYFNQTLQRLPGVTNPRSQKDLRWYHNYYADARIDQCWGEISVQYMAVEGTAQEIYNYNPNVKILAILRNPPKQVFSHYNYLLQRGVLNSNSLKAAMKERPDLLASTFYYQQLKPYYDLFPRENIKVMLFDDLRSDNAELYKSYLDFLGLEHIIPDSLNASSNVTQAPKFAGLTYFIQNTRHFITKHNLEFLIPILRKTGVVQLGTFIRDKWNVKKVDKKPKLDPELEQEMRQYYQEDIEKLETLLDRDLSAWKPLAQV